jgi:WD40 repeat protein
MTWDVTDPAHPFQLGVAMSGQTDAVLGAVFSHDGRVLISGSLDGTLVVWDQTWVTTLRSKAHELACTYAGGGLDRTQWTLYAGGLDYVDSCRN